MVSALLSIVIFLIVVGVIFYCFTLLLGVVPMDPDFKNAASIILKVAAILCILFYLLQVFGLYSGPGFPILRVR
jgi:hypothetical protein